MLHVYVISEMKFYDNFKQVDADWKILGVFSEKRIVEAYSRIVEYLIDEIDMHIENNKKEYDVTTDEEEENEEVMTVNDISSDEEIEIKTIDELTESEDCYDLRDWPMIRNVVINEENIIKAYKFLNNYFENIKKPVYQLKKGTYFKIDRMLLV